MAKKKSTLGKVIAFTTTIAAIGGACYIFRDKIRESELYQKSKEAFSSLRNKMSDKSGNEHEEDDFFFEEDFEDNFEDDMFSEDAKNNREYTSITINPKENTPDSAKNDVEHNLDIENTASDDVNKTEYGSQETNTITESTNKELEDNNENMKEIFADVSIPTISFGSSPEKKDETSATEEVLGYENEGLSDVYEDPNALEDQDRLDF